MNCGRFLLLACCYQEQCRGNAGTPRRRRIEVLIETFLRKQLGLKAHTVTKVEETERFMVVHIDRLGSRLLRCGLCRQRCRKVHSLQKPRGWRGLSISEVAPQLASQPP